MDLRKLDQRLLLLRHIEGRENKARKERSFKTNEIYNDNLRQYVWEYLREGFQEKTLKEMPIVSSVNIARRLVKEEAKIYSESPKREFTELEEEQVDAVTRIYEDMKSDFMLAKANEFYKLQNQCLLQVVPKDGKLIMRVLKQHNYDPIPDPNNPEEALGYIISTFDRANIQDDQSNKSGTNYKAVSSMNNSATSDGINQEIGDEDDYKSMLKRYVCWTKSYYVGDELIPGMNFIMDGKGEVLSEDPSNPLGDTLPFVDVASYKDFNYFVSESDLVSNFSIEFCGALSDLMFVSRMQGWSQAYLKAPADMSAENISIGPTKVIHLPITMDEPEPEFGFSSPNSDLQGSIQTVEFLLKCFLTSRGLSTSTVTGQGEVEKHSSGIERLLAKLDRAEATKEDYHLFENAEQEVYELIKKWHNALRETGQLNDEYLSGELPEASKMGVTFNKPEMFQSKTEKLDYNMKRYELGIGSRTTILMDVDNMSREEAEEYLEKVDQENIFASAPLPEAVEEQ